MDIQKNIDEIRAQFPILKRKMNGFPLDYLDSSATTLKPKPVIDAVVNYYEYLGANAHRGDYQMSLQVDTAFEGARKIMQKYINAARPEEICFTSGATEGLNEVAMMVVNDLLQPGDVVLSTETEHASNILPWQQAGFQKGVDVAFVPLDKDGSFSIDNLKKMLDETKNVKVITVAQVSNVLGFEAPVEEIGQICKERGIIFVVDGAQSVAHLPIDVQKMNCDFFCFSGHKMCGPTGIGVMYGKYEMLDKLWPSIFGGESNARFNKNGDLILKKPPEKFESGTQPIEGAIGMGAAATYIESIGRENIHNYELMLKQHFLDRADAELKDKIEIYNRDSKSGIITFNVYDKGQLIFPQDVASYLSSQGIAVRSGQHCAKLMGDVVNAPGTVRASLYFYNNLNDVDRLVEAIKETTFEKVLDIYF